MAVDDLDVEAPSGKITVLVGPSGCGKTTSLRMVNRMIEPTSGRGFPHRSVVDNVATVPLLLGQSRKQARARAMELLERVGLDLKFATRYPAQLSGGQQQRVRVARALADPPVMLMDEPFSAVDPVVRGQLQDEFLPLQSELGKTIVFVTHDIDEAIKLGDQVAVLRVGGRLAQLSPPLELLSRPADAFVAGFVWRDRGYRALGFEAAGDLPASPEPSVALGSDLAAARAASAQDWVLVLDGEQRPQGWLNLDEAATGDGEVGVELLHLGGTLATQDGSLRAALDAALSSPSGRGVVVDEDQRLVGTVTAAGLPHLAVRGAGAAGPADLAASGVAGPTAPLALRPAGRCVGPALHDPVHRVVHGAAGHPGHPDPGPCERRRGTDDLHRRAAGAMGYRRFQRLVQVELPIAVPVIAAGVRVASVSNVSLVAVAATIGVPQLGQLFTAGIQRSCFPPIIIGIVLCVALALVFDTVIVVLTRVLTPWRRAVRSA